MGLASLSLHLAAAQVHPPPPMVGQQGPRSYLNWRLIRQQGTKHLDAPAFHLPYPCVVTKKGESGNLSLVVGLGKVR